jgi:halogenation protein CepH
MERNDQSYFWQAKKVTNVDTTEAAAFAELAGGLTSGDTAVVGFGAAAAELDDAVERLTTADDRVNPLLSTRIVGETFRMGNDLQEQALYGGQDPNVHSGLAVTTDGLSWASA